MSNVEGIEKSFDICDLLGEVEVSLFQASKLCAFYNNHDTHAMLVKSHICVYLTKVGNVPNSPLHKQHACYEIFK